MKKLFQNITPLQWLGIIILFNTTLLGGAGQLGDLSLGPKAVKAVLAIATLGNGFLGGLVTMFGGQGQMIDTVQGFGQVDTVRINASAEKSVAQLAVDPHSKVEAIPTAEAQVQQTAKSV